MENIILIVHVIAAVGVLGLVLIQHGKGADVGASFGSGASQTFFGSSGSGNFLSRLTAILVSIFFITCLSLGIMTSKRYNAGSIDELLKKVAPSEQAEAGSASKTSNASNAGNATAGSAGKANSGGDNDVPSLPNNR